MNARIDPAALTAPNTGNLLWQVSALTARLEFERECHDREIQRLKKRVSDECSYSTGLMMKTLSPGCPPDRIEHLHLHGDLGVLVCHLVYEPCEPENGWPGLMELESAYVGAVDIADRLTDKEVEVIECAAAKVQQRRGALA